MQSFAEQCEALTHGAGFVDVSDRTQIEVSGEDRVAFLHNMCTQDVKKLAIGSGAEAFFTDAKGHVLAFADLFVAPHSIVIDTVPGQASAISKHFNKYIIREDVQLASQADEWVQLLIAGKQAAEKLAPLASLALPENSWQHAMNRIGDHDVFMRRVAWAGPTSLSIVGKSNELESIKSALVAENIIECEASVLETVRIENGVPVYGRDITEHNLPQEIDRNATAIRFDKGCYIGQETVARLDALGHVNKLLVRVKFDAAEVPPPNTPLHVETQKVGTVTSSTFSPQYHAPLALAYVRRAQSTQGSRLESQYGDAEVV